ncbi:hypothetical protein ABPG75_003587 [Micractinium tetrahymenae]
MAAAVRLVPVGARRRQHPSPLECGAACCELPLPSDTGSDPDPAALVEVAGPGMLSLTWLTDAASLRVCREGGVQETLELGDSLADIGVGTRMELLPADAAHGGPGD